MPLQIKFRVWNIAEHRMMYPKDYEAISSDFSQIMWNWDYNCYNNVLEIPEQGIVMQYIWRSDKNGKEIYEDDLISESTVGKIIWNGQGIIERLPVGKVTLNQYGPNIRQVLTGRVKLTNNAENRLRSTCPTGYSDLHMTTYDGEYQWPPDIEVTGNIHENG